MASTRKKEYQGDDWVFFDINSLTEKQMNILKQTDILNKYFEEK